MRIVLVPLIIGLCLLAGCGKNDPVEPALTSVDGSWTYTTPDGTIKVDFDLKKNDSDELIVSNSKITVAGTKGEAATQLFGVNLPAMDSLRINANDAVLVKPYKITFYLCGVSGDFTKINVTDATYTYPWGSVKSLSNISMVRKP